MFHGVWQLAKRTLTLDARRPLPHVIRLGLAAILLVCVIIAWANSLFSELVLVYCGYQTNFG